jgi:hypothetical protein
MDDLDPITEAGKAIYGKFLRVDDYDHVNRRWSRLKPAVRQYFIEEARAAISVYLQLTTGR